MSDARALESLTSLRQPRVARARPVASNGVHSCCALCSAAEEMGVGPSHAAAHFSAAGALANANTSRPDYYSVSQSSGERTALHCTLSLPLLHSHRFTSNHFNTSLRVRC